MTTGTNRSKEQNINPAFRPDPFRCGEEGEPLGGGETERNGSGTRKSNNSIRERVRERAVAFATDFQERGYVAFGDPRHSTVAICIALTGDWKSLARWKLNSENDRKYNTTGKGRHNTAMCEACLPAATRPYAPRRQANVSLPKELQHAMPTLKAIMRNGSDRARSIRELAAERGITFDAARKKYFADRKKLLSFFNC